MKNYCIVSRYLLLRRAPYYRSRERKFRSHFSFSLCVSINIYEKMISSWFTVFLSIVFRICETEKLQNFYARLYEILHDMINLKK